jgi:aminopeptidase N
MLHELAHMWFGNLISINWWSDLWIKEGMAELLSNHVLGDYYCKMAV